MITFGVMANGTFYIPQTGMSCGRMAVSDEKQKNFGILKEDGNPFGQVKYRKVLWFNKDYASCETHSGEVILLDKYGRELPERFEDTQEVYRNYALGRKNGKWHYVDINTGSVSEVHFDRIFFWRYDSGAIVQLGDRFSAIDTDGNLLAEFDYDDASHLGEGKFALQLGKKFAVTGPNGLIIGPELESVGLFRGGIANACKEGVSGYLTENGWTPFR